MIEAVVSSPDDSLYENLRRRVLASETRQALLLLSSVSDSDDRMTLLSRLALPMARTHALDRSLERTLRRARDLSRSLSGDNRLSRALARDLVRDLDQVVHIIEEELLIVGFIVTALASDGSEAAAQVATLLFPNLNRLTPQVLTRDVIPILDAVVGLQESLDRLNNRGTAEVDVLSITGHAVNVDMYGVRQAIDAFGAVIAPRRRAIYARQQAIAANGHRDETERMKAQLAQEKLAILISVYEQFTPNLAPEKRVEEAIRMLPVFERFFTGAELVEVK
jgi:hypothetical protein